MIDSTTWSLTEMSETHLGIAREDIDPEDTAKFFDNVHSSAKHLQHFVLHCEADCYFQMAIASKVQALPLTRQLTNLAGNSWCVAGNDHAAMLVRLNLLHRRQESHPRRKPSRAERVHSAASIQRDRLHRPGQDLVVGEARADRQGGQVGEEEGSGADRRR